MQKNCCRIGRKNASIVQVYKKGSKSEPGNYRPVSMTYHIGKLMEKLVEIRKMFYVEENLTLFMHPNGFLRKKLC